VDHALQVVEALLATATRTEPMRIFAADVDNRCAPPTHTKARGAAAICDSWRSERAIWESVALFDSVGDYESGAFYKRELPCLVALFESAQRAGLGHRRFGADWFCRTHLRCNGP